jgi:hypothetical protein
MKNLFDTLIDGARSFLLVSPMLIILPFLVYTSSDEGKSHVNDWIQQTPAKGLVSGGYDYYPNYLEDGDIVIQQKKYVDESGEEFTGALIEIKRPIAFAKPADTGSMQPMFGAGNMLIQEVVNEQTKLQSGDIIVYEYENKLIIHQIVGKVEDCFITKGMNNSLPDSVCVEKDMVKYRLLFSIPTN